VRIAPVDRGLFQHFGDGHLELFEAQDFDFAEMARRTHPSAPPFRTDDPACGPHMEIIVDAIENGIQQSSGERISMQRTGGVRMICSGGAFSPRRQISGIRNRVAFTCTRCSGSSREIDRGYRRAKHRIMFRCVVL
jgi:hypothetical protein